jgi:hypothetical protein
MPAPSEETGEMLMTATEVIRILGLTPLPVEGGYFLQTWRSDDTISREALPPWYPGPRACGTAIYYLLTSETDCFSAMHALATDEVYHFYLGDPVEMLLLYPDGRSREIVLGPNLRDGQWVQFVVPRGVWQGSRLVSGGRFALLGTTMAPGFDPQDFILGKRNELQQRYPERTEWIGALTRN